MDPCLPRRLRPGPRRQAAAIYLAAPGFITADRAFQPMAFGENDVQIVRALPLGQIRVMPQEFRKGSDGRQGRSEIMDQLGRWTGGTAVTGEAGKNRAQEFAPFKALRPGPRRKKRTPRGGGRRHLFGLARQPSVFFAVVRPHGKPPWLRTFPSQSSFFATASVACLI